MGRSSGCRSATDDDAYPSGWRYTLHYGRLTPGPETLEDGQSKRPVFPYDDLIISPFAHDDGDTAPATP
nr:hypothetical protein [Natrinema altunense]